MKLFEEIYVWSPCDSQTDQSFSFFVPETVEQIRIRFEYSPGKEEDPAVCLPPVHDALNRYYDSYPRELQPMKEENFIPIKNLVTISLDKDGVYLGNAHRWAPQQEHLISVRKASLGFVSPAVLAGKWHGMLHLHEILSGKCTGHLLVEGESTT